MNRSYRLIWNRALRALQVASEIARPRAGGTATAGESRLRKHPLALACAAAVVAALALQVAPNAVAITTGGGGSCSAPGGAGGAGGNASNGGNGSHGAQAPNDCGYAGALGGAGGHYGLGATTSGGNDGDAVVGGAGGAGRAGGFSGGDNIPFGGGGGGGGGAGVVAIGAIVFTNTGSITGGVGGAGGAGSGNYALAGYAGQGGAGAVLASSSGGPTVINTGTITGGAGGVSGGASTGSSGGAGVASNGGTLINSGTITGGAGSAGAGVITSGGSGGAGVLSTGGLTVVTSGRIAGGVGAAGTVLNGINGNGPSGNAVDFSGGGNTLTLESGYSFTGNVVSTSGSTNGGDTLALGGDTSPNGAFDLGDVVATVPTSPVAGTTYYAGFNNLAKTGGSTWVVTGSNTGAFTGGITVSAGTLQVGDGVTAASLNAGSGDMMVAGGATLSGFGTVDPALTTIATGGTLSPGAAGAIGTLNIDGDLDLLGNLAIGINGTGAGNFDLLNVTGSSTFGTSTAFDFSFGNGFGGAANDTFQFFNAGSFFNFADIGNHFTCSNLTAGLTCGLSDVGEYLLLTLNGSGGNGGVAAVPEPGDLGMLGGGLFLLGGLIVFDRRRSSHRARER